MPRDGPLRLLQGDTGLVLDGIPIGRLQLLNPDVMNDSGDEVSALPPFNGGLDMFPHALHVRYHQRIVPQFAQEKFVIVNQPGCVLRHRLTQGIRISVHAVYAVAHDKPAIVFAFHREDDGTH